MGEVRRLENSKEVHNSGSELPVDVSRNPLKLCKGWWKGCRTGPLCPKLKDRVAFGPVHMMGLPGSTDRDFHVSWSLKTGCAYRTEDVLR